MQIGSISELMFSSKNRDIFYFYVLSAALRLCVSPFMLMVIFTSLFLDIVGYVVVKYI
nr:MAG TPA: hypothetical protein [Caudoviricetes sp.]